VENGRGATKRPSSRSRSRSRSRSTSPRRRHGEGNGGGRDLSPPNGPPSGIRIEGQADVERQRNKMDTSEVRLRFTLAYYRCVNAGRHRTPMLARTRRSLLAEKASSKKRRYVIKSFAQGKERRVIPILRA
jgi:hypothetical protein